MRGRSCRLCGWPAGAGSRSSGSARDGCAVRLVVVWGTSSVLASSLGVSCLRGRLCGVCAGACCVRGSKAVVGGGLAACPGGPCLLCVSHVVGWWCLVEAGAWLRGVACGVVSVALCWPCMVLWCVAARALCADPRRAGRVVPRCRLCRVGGYELVVRVAGVDGARCRCVGVEQTCVCVRARASSAGYSLCAFRVMNGY